MCVRYKSVLLLHSMGMSHDDDHAACTGHSHIMSGEWVKGRNPSDLSWSTCSRDDLENFLRWDIVIAVSPPLYILKQYWFPGPWTDLGMCTYMERLFNLNGILEHFPFYALLQTRTTGVVSVQFAVNSSRIQLQWETKLTLNHFDWRKWAKKCYVLWVAGIKHNQSVAGARCVMGIWTNGLKVHCYATRTFVGGLLRTCCCSIRECLRQIKSIWASPSVNTSNEASYLKQITLKILFIYTSLSRDISCQDQHLEHKVKT